MHIPCTGIITQALPLIEQFLLSGSGQELHTGESLHKPLIIWESLLNSGLLKNDLRNPYLVWIPAQPPGKLPLVFPVPPDEVIAYCHEFVISKMQKCILLRFLSNIFVMD